MAKSAIGSLYVTLTANTGAFGKSMRRAARQVKQLRDEFNTAAKYVVGFGSAIVASAGAAAAYFVKQSMAEIDASAKLSRELGIQIDSLRGLQQAAKLSGTSGETLTKGIKRMTYRLGEAKLGIGEGVKGLEMMGLKAEDLAAMKPDEAFMAIADGIKSLPDPMEQAAAAYAIFGRQGQEMMTILQGGGQAMRDVVKDSKRLRGSISDLDAKRIEKANDAMTRMGDAITGVWDKIAIAVAPVIEMVAKEGAEAFVSLRKSVAREVANVIDAVLALDDSGAIGKFLDHVKAAIAGLVAMAQTAAMAIKAVSAAIARALDSKKAAQYDALKDRIEANIKINIPHIDEELIRWQRNLDQLKLRADPGRTGVILDTRHVEEIQGVEDHIKSLRNQLRIYKEEVANAQGLVGQIGFGFDPQAQFDDLAKVWGKALDRSMGATAHSVIPQHIKDMLKGLSNDMATGGRTAAESLMSSFGNSIKSGAMAFTDLLGPDVSKTPEFAKLVEERDKALAALKPKQMGAGLNPDSLREMIGQAKAERNEVVRSMRESMAAAPAGVRGEMEAAIRAEMAERDSQIATLGQQLAGAMAKPGALEAEANRIAEDFKAKVEALRESVSQPTLEPQQYKYAGAALRGTAEAYRASLPQEGAKASVDKATKETAKNTAKTVTTLDKLAAILQRGFESGPEPAPI